jgi:hypothetical protein
MVGSCSSFARPLKVRTAFGLFFAVVLSGLGLAWSVVLAWNEHEFHADAVRTTGIVTGKKQDTTGRGKGVYYFVYQYVTTDGQVLSRTAAYGGKALWDSVPVGSTCQVAYLPRRPDDSRLLQANLETVELAPNWFPAGLVLVVTMVCFGIGIRLLRSRRQSPFS